LLATGVVGVGLLAFGTVYAGTHGSSGLLDSLTRQVSAQEATPTGAPSAKPNSPAAANSKQPTGQVTLITSEPASFTMRAADGTLTTYRVLDTTVFMAGRDRPYRFDLLKQGDTVIVRGGQQGRNQGRAQGQGQARGAANGELIARQVVVRPAGEAGPGHKRQGAGAQNGGSDGAGQ
jgi:hypothetical protein